MIVLDPRISYEGMKLNYTEEGSLVVYLKSSKKNLYEYYKTHYTDKHSTPLQMTDSMPRPSANALAPPCLKKILHHALNRRQRWPSMNLMNSSSFLKRILRLAIQFVSGLVAMLNSPTFFTFAWDILCIPGCVLHCY